MNGTQTAAGYAATFLHLALLAVYHCLVQLSGAADGIWHYELPDAGGLSCLMMQSLMSLPHDTAQQHQL
jgi:hypothetical protein